MRKKDKKILLLPVIYNNGDKNIRLKTNNKEVYSVQDNFTINEELKQLLISDTELTELFIISILHNIYKTENPHDHEVYNCEEYNAYNEIIKSDEKLKNTLLNAYNNLLNNDMINTVVKDYEELARNEAISLVYSLSHLLYLQDIHKDNIVGQEIDKTIKEWLGFIKNYDEKAITEALTLKNRQDNPKEYEKALKIMSARVFYLITTQYHLKLKDYTKEPVWLELWNYNALSMEDLKGFLNNSLTNILEDSKTYKQYSEKINDYIDDLQKKYKLSKSIEKKQTWQDNANKYINHINKYKGTDDKVTLFTMDYVLKHLAYSDYQKQEYKLNLDEEIIKVNTSEEQQRDEKFLQTTSKHLRAIDNARGGLVTYNESNAQAIKNEIKEKQESLKNTQIKHDKVRLKKEIEDLNKKLVIAEKKEQDLKEQYKSVNEYLTKIYESMEKEPKTSSYYKDLKKSKKEQEKRKKELERIIRFNGWQLDMWGNGSYEVILNKRKKESLKLTIENLSKQIAKYTKEEQDLFDFLISKYLHNTDIKVIKFNLREYEKAKNRARPTNNLNNDIQAIKLLFREVWTYYTTSDNSYTFNEEHLFTRLNIKGKLESDLNNLNNANLDAEISLEPTETLQKLLQDHDNYVYTSTSPLILQLNNDKEYLAKRLIKYLNYLSRVNKKSLLEVSLDTIIEELQHYGLKHYNMLDRHKTFKTEIVDVLDKTISILEGENHLNEQFIEVLDRTPFINYDEEFRGKNQETTINSWGKQKLKIKVFNLDENKLIDTKRKQNKNKKRTTKK